MKIENKSHYKNSKEQLKEKLENLITIIEIMDKDVSDYQKVCVISNIYQTQEQFRKAYSLIIKYGKNDPMFKDYIEKIEIIKIKLKEYEEKGIFNDVNYLKGVENYLENYDYARFAITTFIESNRSYNKTNFLNELGITEEIFDYCLKVVEELDVDLLKKYEEKKEENKILRYNANIYTFKNIAHGIKTGKLFDGTEFNLIEFWRLVPFKYKNGIRTEFDIYTETNKEIYFQANNFFRQVEHFTQTALCDESKIIMNYMREHKIYSYHYTSEEELKKIYSTNKIILANNRVFTKEEVSDVAEYIKVKKLPFLSEVFKLVRQKYVDDEIDMEEIRSESKKNQSKVKTLIPIKKN